MVPEFPQMYLLDCNIEVNEFELELICYIHFPANTLRKSIQTKISNKLILSSSFYKDFCNLDDLNVLSWQVRSGLSVHDCTLWQ